MRLSFLILIIVFLAGCDINKDPYVKAIENFRSMDEMTARKEISKNDTCMILAGWLGKHYNDHTYKMRMVHYTRLTLGGIRARICSSPAKVINIGTCRAANNLVWNNYNKCEDLKGSQLKEYNQCDSDVRRHKAKEKLYVSLSVDVTNNIDQTAKWSGKSTKELAESYYAKNCY